MDLCTSSHRRLAGLVALVAAAVAALVVAPAPAAAEVRPICFPVLDTPVHYVGNFGDPRDGGARSHEGEDIMGQSMFRLVAAVDGVVLNGTDGVRWRGTGHRDHSLRIRGDDGYYYAYLHMNDDTPGTDDDLASYDQVFAPGIVPGARVRAGQLVGYMGDSGNAGEGNDHLHFEIRTPAASVWSSTAIDPWDSLQAARRCSPLNSPTHPFTEMGGASVDAPDVTSAGSGTFDGFVRGLDGRLWQKGWNGGFTTWAPLGGSLRGGPAAASPAAGRLDVFVRGVDDQLWQRTRTGSIWGPWTPLGGILRSDPDATAGGGTIDVVGQGSDGQVWSRSYDGIAWGPWEPLGGGMHGGPAIATTDGGARTVLLRGLDDGLWARESAGASWGEWRPLGGLLTSDPDAVGIGSTLHVVVRGIDERIHHLDTSRGWMVVSLEAVGAGPSITSWGDGRLDVLAVSLDRAVYQTWNLGSGW